MPFSPRVVPNGGLGGCVEILGETCRDDRSFSSIARQSWKKRLPPPKNRETRNDRGACGRVRTRLDAPLPPTPVTPIDFHDAPVWITSEDSAPPFSPWSPQWPVNENDIFFGRAPAPCTQTPTSCQTPGFSPVELPGSLLLPSQGFTQTNPPCTPPRPFKHFRASRSWSSQDTVPSLTNSCESSPESGSHSPSTFNSYRLQKRLPELPSPENSFSRDSVRLLTDRLVEVMSENKEPKSFAAMGAAELIRSISLLGPEETTKEWMRAMQGELARLRAWIEQNAAETTVESTVLQKFVEREIKDMIRVARETCRSHGEVVQRAQAAHDPNHQTLFKRLEHTDVEIDSMLLAMRDKRDHNVPVSKPEHVEVCLALHRSTMVVAEFVRVQLGLQLRRQNNGLNAYTISVIRGFDRADQAVTLQQERSSPSTTSSEETGWSQSKVLEAGEASGDLNREPPTTSSTTTTQRQTQERARDQDLQLSPDSTGERLKQASRQQSRMNKYNDEADEIHEIVLARQEVDMATAAAATAMANAAAAASARRRRPWSAQPRNFDASIDELRGLLAQRDVEIRWLRDEVERLGGKVKFGGFRSEKREEEEGESGSRSGRVG